MSRDCPFARTLKKLPLSQLLRYCEVILEDIPKAIHQDISTGRSAMNNTCFVSVVKPNSSDTISNATRTNVPCPMGPLFQRYLYAAFIVAFYLSVLSVVTLATNLPLVVVFIKNPSKTFRSPTAYFLIGIAITDVMTALVVEPCLYYCYFRMYLKGIDDSFTRITCTKMTRVAAATSLVALNASFLTVLTFTIAQYLAIASPMRMARYITAKSVLITQLVIWIYCFAYSISFTLADELKLASQVDAYCHNIVVTLLLLALYALLFRTFRRKMANSGQLQSESSRQGRKSQTRRLQMQRKFVVINLLLIIVLIVCTVPSTISWIADSTNLTKHLDRETYSIYHLIFSECFVLTKFVLDPFVYVWRLPVYRKALYHVFCRGSHYEHRGNQLQRGSDLPLAISQQNSSTVTLCSLQTYSINFQK